MALCFAAFGGFRYFLHSRGIGYINHFLITTTYFVSFAVCTSFLFREQIERVLADFSAVPLIVLTIFIAVQTVLVILVPAYIRKPVEYLAAHSDRYYLDIHWRRLIAKSADILAQQVFIVLIILFLREAGLSLLQTIFAFTVLFGILHIPLIASERGAWPSWLFAAIVVMFSIAFPILILSVPYGFVYTFMIHWLYYTVLAVGFWLYDARQEH